MTFVSNRARRSSPWSGALALAAIFAIGCAKGEKGADTTAVPAASASQASPGTMEGANKTTTGDADHDFLRMMSNHHQGLIAIVHMAIERKDVGGSLADAKKLDDAQDKELDRMVTMLEKDYKDPYEPKIMPEHQAMVDVLKPKTGKDYDRAFYENIIKHHEEAIKMIDAYLPTAKSPAVKQMATGMKAAQSREITDFKAKVAKLGA